MLQGQRNAREPGSYLLRGQASPRLVTQESAPGTLLAKEGLESLAVRSVTSKSLLVEPPKEPERA